MKKFDLTKIHEGPVAIQLMVALVVAVVFLYFGYWFDLSSLRMRTEAAQQSEKDLLNQFKATLDDNVKLKNSLTLLPKLKKTSSEWQNKIIPRNAFPELQDRILKLDEITGAKFNDFVPGKETKSGSYIVVPVKIDAQGSFDQIASLVSELANMQQLISIKNFTITREPSAPNAPADTQTSLNADMPFKTELNIEIYEQ